MSAYRDGVFSVSSPAPRYGALTSVFENGSLGEVLEDNAAALLDPALNQLVAALNSAEPAAHGYRQAAVALASRALLESDINEKLPLAVAAGYAASAFGLPPNTLLGTVGQICDTFAMTGNQRAALHQQGASLLHKYLSSQKGSPMSGVYEDGVLGSVYQDGVLGATKTSMIAHAGGKARPLVPRTVRQPKAMRDGSLGALMYQPSAFHDGALGLAIRKRASAARKLVPGYTKSVSGCGCAGLGEEAVPETPFYKKPLVLGGAAIGLGVVIYALSRK